MLPCFRKKFAEVMVVESMALLNTADRFAVRATLVAVLAGTVELTVGGELSKRTPVVKVQVLAATSERPPEALSPVVSVAR